MLLDFAQVVAIHPESNSIDVVLMKNGRRIAGVQVLQRSAGSTFGFTDMSIPDLTDDDPFETVKTGTQDIYCVVGAVGSSPVCLGFLFPQVAQCLFEEKEFRVDRHTSDVYSTTDKDGNVEVYHPSGTYFRVGVSPDHVDLTEKDYDKTWRIRKNTDKAVHVHLEVANGGATVATINIDPAGNIDIVNSGRTHLHSAGDIEIKSDTHIGLIAPRIDLN